MSDPGWYLDPYDDTRLRFWDGTSWTERVAPLPDPAAGLNEAGHLTGGGDPAETASPNRRRPPAAAIAGVGLLLVALAAVSALLLTGRTTPLNDGTASPTNTPDSSTPAETTDPPASNPPDPAPTTAPAPAPTTPVPSEQDVLNASIPGDLPQSCNPADRLTLRDGVTTGTTTLGGVTYQYGVRVAQRADDSWMIATGRPEGGNPSAVTVVASGCEGSGRERGFTLLECSTTSCARLAELRPRGPFPSTTNVIEPNVIDLTAGDGFIEVTLTLCAAEPGCGGEVQRWVWTASGVELLPRQ